ncbi:MAG: hypothetical protein HOO96_11000 [Polyangiaceae bacterium]|nr:hypothetical protein [Polyangiaceae bacterium]
MQMKLVAVAAVVTAGLFAATAREASAAPILGAKEYGQSFARSAYKGDFGASFEVGAKAYANDYAQLCATSDPGYQCGGMAVGFVQNICRSVYTIINGRFCAQNVGTKMGFGAYGGAEADVRLFGKDLEIFDLSADAKVEPDAITTGYGIYVAGAKISGYRSGAHFEKSVPLAERTLVKASSTFMLGPIPIAVQARAVGSLGIDFTLDGGTAQVTATAEPWAQVDGVFSAGIGVSGVSAGIEGDLLLARVGVPGTGKIVWLGEKKFSYEASLDLSLKTLDGSVSLYAEGLGHRASWEIVSWNGLDWSWNLGRKTGAFAL